MNENEKQELRGIFASLLVNLKTTNFDNFIQFAIAIRSQIKERNLQKYPNITRENLITIMLEYFESTDSEVIEKIVEMIITKDIQINE